MRRTFAAVLAVGAALSAPALASDNPACAKFEEALAYNACLARLGPPARGVRAATAPEGEGEAESAPAHAHHGGRARVEFDLGSGSRRRQ